MSHTVKLSETARKDLKRLYDFLLERDADFDYAERALNTIAAGLKKLEDFAYANRKAGDGTNPFLRELLITFGDSGYVVLYQIDDQASVTVAAMRHQREEDYH